MRARVLGIGSPHGDDAVGPAVAQALVQGGLPPGVDAFACDRPGLRLLDLLEGVDAAILVDALRTGTTPGRVVEVDPRALARSRGGSSHGLGVAEAIALAEALGWLPRIAIVGIAIGSLHGGALSPPVRAAIAPACARVRAQLARFAGIPPLPASSIR